MKEFSDFTEDMSLVDLPLEDAKHTWFRRDNQVAASGIDRFLIPEDWDDYFKNLKQSPL